jgi:hypothetical protein
MKPSLMTSIRILIILILITTNHACKKEDPPKLPEVSTIPVTNITATTASGGGNIITDGGAEITEKGVCWSLTANPTTSNSKTSGGTGPGQFVSNIAGLAAGTTYYVRAFATNSVGTDYGSDVSFSTLGQAPATIIQPATNLSVTGATLNGTVNANHLSTTVTFEYGTTISYGSTSIATQSPVTGNSIINVSVSISGLSPGTICHYRIKAVNSIGTVYSSDIQFVTLGQVPTVYTIASSNITSTGAKLNGTVNANYLSTDVTFEYGTTTNYGNTITAIQSPVTGNSSTVVNSIISGLTIGLTYHYRVKANNVIGSSFGIDMTFTTAYSIGENVNGGLVFYIDNTGKHGLVCAPTDQGTVSDWGCWGTTINGADGTIVGTGNQNTTDIITGCTEDGIAAKICYDLDLNGYTDWFLPSKDELGLMYTNLKTNGFGDFTGHFYWSSSEGPNNDAWAQIFSSGDQARLAKNSLDHLVRAVRIF